MTGRWGYGSRQERLDMAQWEGINAWVARPNLANGTLMWHTGVGKTHACYKAYGRFRTMFPAEDEINNIIVVVPSLKLKEDWTKPGGHIEKWNLQNIEVFVINSYITEHHNCRLLIIDEIHRVLGKEAEAFNKTIDITSSQFRLGLSATLTFEEQETLRNKGIPVVHVISEVEAKEEGFTSDYIEYNLAVKLNEIEQREYIKYSDMHDRNKRYFVISDQFDFKTAMSCTSNDSACKRVAIYRGWRPEYGKEHDDSPQNIKKYANMWNKGMSQRKNILYSCMGKIEATEKLINKFSDATIMTFSQTAEMADAITQRFPDIARSYHTKVTGEERPVAQMGLFTDNDWKLKKGKTKKVGAKAVKDETLIMFATRKIRVMNAVKALDEGYDLPLIDMSIILAGSSKGRQHKQRKGRSTRFDHDNHDKKSMIVNLYVKETQDEKWLKERQENDNRVHWVDDVDEITYDQSTENQDFNIASNNPRY